MYCLTDNITPPEDKTWNTGNQTYHSGVRIVVDARVFSTPAANRGMGNYVRELIRDLKKNEFTICFIGYQLNRVELEKELRLFSIGESDFIELDLNPNTIADPEKASTVTNKIETAISKLKGSIYLDATPFIAPARIDIKIVPVIAILYDLIPLMMKEAYLVSPWSTEQYLLSIRAVKNADLVVSISKYVAELGVNWLDLSIEKLHVIYPKVPKIEDSGREQGFELNNFGLLMGGLHPSKNPKQIYEFCKKVADFINDGELVLLFPNQGDKKRFQSTFGLVSEKIKVYESISDLDKNWLLRNCKVFLNFSLLEGFGIPIQEAIQSHIPVISINTEVNREMNLKVELVEGFDLVNQILAKFLLRLRMPRVHTRVNPTLTSQGMYESFFNSIMNLANDRQITLEELNLFSPLSPIPCGISKLSSEILEYLASCNIKVAAYIDDQPLPTLINFRNIKFYSASSYTLHAPDTPTWFQLGGATWFTQVYRAIQVKNSGKKFAFVHDLDISGGLFDICRVGKMQDFWKEIFELEREVNKNFPAPSKDIKSGNPLLSWLDTYFDGIFSHLPHISWPEHVDTKKWTYIPQGRQSSPSHRELFNSVSKDLEIFSGFNVGVFGSVLENKRIDKIIESIKHLDKDVNLLIVGRTPDLDYFNRLKGMISNFSLTKRVHFVRDPDESRFYGLMSRINLLVSLRDNRIGQVSGPLLQAFSLGVPVIAEKSIHWSELISGAPYSFSEDPSLDEIEKMLHMLSTDEFKLGQLGQWSSSKYAENSVSFMTTEALRRTILEW
jgi:glycosyltransferase involved in cell wall biosynthesis